MILASAMGAAALLFAAFTDVMRRIIPDGAVIFVALAGIVLRIGDGTAALVIGIAVAVAIFAVMLVLFQFHLVGGGDVKLLAAASLLLPYGDVPQQLSLIAISGGVLALLWIIDQRLRGASTLSADAPSADKFAFSPLESEPDVAAGFQEHGLPYGVAICIGTLASMALST